MAASDDIDLLIGLQGDGKVKAQLASVQQTATRFRSGLVQASAAMQGFDSAMDELNKTGKVSQSTISQLTFLMPLLANPVTAVAVGVGAIVQQMMRMNAEQKELAGEIAQNRVASLSRQAAEAVIVLTRMAGAIEEDKETLGQLGRIQSDQSNAARDYAESMAMLAAEEKRTGESRAGAMERETVNYIRSSAARETNKQSLEAEIDARKRARDAAESERRELERFIKTQDTQRTMFFAQAQAREDAGLDGGLLAAQIDDQKFARQQLITEMQREAETNGYVTHAQLAELTAIEATIFALERQAATYEFVGNVARDAIGGVAAGAFDAYADAMDKTVSLNAIFAGGFDRALRNQASAVVRSVGQQAAVRSVFELAEGFAALGSPFTAPFASFHFKAAALFGGIALGAGAGAGLLSVKPGGAGGGAPSGANPSGGSGKDSTSGGGPNIQVVVIGNLDTQGRKDLGAQLRQEFYEGGG